MMESAEPTWPTHLEGRALVRLPALPDDARFVGNTGAHVARFTDGEAEILIRWMLSLLVIDGPTPRGEDELRSLLHRRMIPGLGLGPHASPPSAPSS